MLQDDELFLFTDWIFPNTIEDFRGKEILECGSGGGQHTSFIAPYAIKITAVDLNSIDIAAERNKSFTNIEFIDRDIATMNLGKQFDIVFSIGVVHHTDDPDKTVENLIRHVKPGGTFILNVFDKLCSPQVDFISKESISQWFDKTGFKRVSISSYKGVTCRGSGVTW